MLTIARLTKYSIAYYNETADEAREAAMNGQKSQRRTGRVLLGRRTRIPRLAFRR
jgi:hypothetical protein